MPADMAATQGEMLPNSALQGHRSMTCDKECQHHAEPASEAALRPLEAIATPLSGACLGGSKTLKRQLRHL